MTQPVHSVLFDQQELYDPQQEQLHFYTSQYDPTTQQPYYQPPTTHEFYAAGQIGHEQFGLGETGWLAAFGTGGLPGEAPLLQELGINFDHIQTKTLAALNPVQTVQVDVMEDADLAGPLLFCVLFAFFLLLSGKVHFGYIYGVAVFGCVALYAVMNWMSESGTDIWKTASILGYCLLPMVLLSGISAVYTLNGKIGAVLAILTVCWCTFAASGMFTVMLRLHDQRALVAYPVGLLYACFAIITVF